MKIGKYPVKHSYKIARLVSDVFSLGLAVLIFSATVGFFREYRTMLAGIGEENLTKILAEHDPMLVNRQWFALIFPALVAAVFAAYIVLCLKSHPFKRYNVTKLTAQSCQDIYVFCASLCKIPLLMGIFDVMYIVCGNLLGGNEPPFSLQILLDALIIAIIIRFGIHRVMTITEKKSDAPDSGAITVKAVSAENKNTDGAAVTVKIKPADTDTREEKK